MKAPGRGRDTVVDGVELACRMAETCTGMKRPAHMTAQQAMDAMDTDIRMLHFAVAQTVLDYFAECAGAVAVLDPRGTQPERFGAAQWRYLLGFPATIGAAEEAFRQRLLSATPDQGGSTDLVTALGCAVAAARRELPR